MNPIIRNILAFLAGSLTGMVVNMGTLFAMMALIPPPEGMIPGDMESLKAHIGDFELQHFLTPFLAHSLGALVGALVAAKLAVSRQMMIALTVGLFFLLGGISMVFSVDAPLWYDVVDLTLAYIPMAWIGWKIAGGK